MKQPRFATIDEYAACFNDVDYWRPYVMEICRRHGMVPVRHVLAGLAGTFPVFIVDQRYVVKLYGELFDGVRRFRTERVVYGLLTAAPQIAAPSLRADGRLYPDQPVWSWPYLITTALPGRSLGEDSAQVPYENLESIVGWLGRQVRALYELALPDTGELPATWEGFTMFLSRRLAGCVDQHRSWGSLPPQLLEQLDGYLLPVDLLVDRSASPRLLHSDLNADHVLGVFEGATWKPSGMIDFGDVIVGDPIYDLVALHVGLTHCNKQLLKIFLDASATGLERDPMFARRAMCATLLFEFNVLDQVFAEHPAARSLASLDELAAWMWQLEKAA